MVVPLESLQKRVELNATYKASACLDLFRKKTWRLAKKLSPLQSQNEQDWEKRKQRKAAPELKKERKGRQKIILKYFLPEWKKILTFAVPKRTGLKVRAKCFNVTENQQRASLKEEKKSSNKFAEK